MPIVHQMSISVTKALSETLDFKTVKNQNSEMFKKDTNPIGKKPRRTIIICFSGLLIAILYKYIA